MSRWFDIRDEYDNRLYIWIVLGLLVSVLVIFWACWYAIDKQQDRKEDCASRDDAAVFINGGRGGDDFCIDKDRRIIKVYS